MIKYIKVSANPKNSQSVKASVHRALSPIFLSVNVCAVTPWAPPRFPLLAPLPICSVPCVLLLCFFRHEIPKSKSVLSHL